MKTNKTCQFVSAANEIGPEGAVTLFETLKSNSTLTYLNLQGIECTSIKMGYN